jgi:hypothetical protein
MGRKGPIGARGGGDLTLLLGYEQGEGGPAPRLLEALLELRSGGGPPAVREAADRLVRGHASSALDLAKLARDLIAAAGSERDQRLFLVWSLRRQVGTFEELATQEGVCRQNVNRLTRRAEARVRDALGTSPAPLRWAVSTLRARLGAVAPAGQLSAELDRLGAAEPPVPELLAWLAGPYHPVPGPPGWVATNPSEALARTASCLAEDGGVRRLIDVRAELADLGITGANLEPWLRTRGAAMVHDVAVSVRGPLGDVVERLLDAHGTARSPEEIGAELAECGRAVDATTLAGPLGNRRRFARTAAGGVRLAAWGENARPPAKDAHHRPPPKRQAQRASEAPAAEARASQERLWLWVRVDADVLRGSEAAVPVALVEGLGLAPLARRTFSGRWGPVTLAHEPPQPTRGPVRAVALAAGARPEDTLLLGFSARGDLDVEVRRGSGQVGPPEGVATEVTVFPELASGGAP